MMTLEEFTEAAGSEAGRIKVMLSYFDMILSMTEKERKSLVETVMKGVRCFNSKDGKETSEGIRLADYLLSREFELLGFVPNFMYCKVEGDKDELKSTFVHPWGAPCLAFYKKQSCAIIFVGPGIRWNKVMLDEIDANGVRFSGDIRGATS